MFEQIINYLGAWANTIVVLSTIVGAVLWSHIGLAKDIHQIREDTKVAHARIDQMNHRFETINQRIDATNQRMDHTYDLILEIVREGKKDNRGEAYKNVHG